MNHTSIAEVIKDIFERLYYRGTIKCVVQVQATEPRRSEEPLFVRDGLTIYRAMGNIFEFVPDEAMLRQLVSEDLMIYVLLAAAEAGEPVEKLRYRIRFRLTADYLEQMTALRDELFPSKLDDE